MRDTIELVVKALVDDPDAVEVREVDRNGTTRLEIHVAQPDMIAYGAEVERRPDPLVRRWRVEPNRYVLYVSRLEPENNAHLVIEAFKRVRTAHKLVIVGDAPYARDYINDLKARARRDKRIVFTGFVFGRDYRALQQNAYCYVHATEVGGTHPALLEAMMTIASDR